MLQSTTARLPTLWVHDERFSRRDVVINPDLFKNVALNDLLEIYHPTTSAGSAKMNNRLVLQVTGFEEETLAKQPQLQISVAKDIAALFELQPRTPVVVRKVEKSGMSADFVEFSFKDQYVGRSVMWGLKVGLQNTCLYVGKKVTNLGVRAQVKELMVNGKSVPCAYITENTRTIFRSESAKYFILIQMSKEMWEFDEDGELYFEKCVHGFLPELFTSWKRIGTNHIVSVVLFTRIYFDNDTVAGNRSSDANAESEEFGTGVESTGEEYPGDDIPLQTDASGRIYRDFYRVVVDWETSLDWNQVLVPIKREFIQFQKHVLLRNTLDGSMILSGRNSSASEGNVLEAVNLALNPFDKHYIDRDLQRTGLSIVVVSPSPGLFEVDKTLCRLTTQRMIDNGIGCDFVSLSKPPLYAVPLFQFISHDSSRDMKYTQVTNTSIVNAVSASALSANKQIHDHAGSHVGTDMSHKPEQSAQPGPEPIDTWDPLFYDEPATANNLGNERIYFTIPTWVELSFYDRAINDSFKKPKKFVVRCRMSELQNLVTDGSSTIYVEPLNLARFGPEMVDNEEGDELHTARRAARLEAYDAEVFGSHEKKEFIGGDGRFRSSLASQSGSEPQHNSPAAIPGAVSIIAGGGGGSSGKVAKSYDSNTEENSLIMSGAALTISKDRHFSESAKNSPMVTNQIPIRIRPPSGAMRYESPSNISSINMGRHSYTGPSTGFETFRPSVSPVSEAFTRHRISPGPRPFQGSGGASGGNGSGVGIGSGGGGALRNGHHRQNYINPCNPSKNVVRISSFNRRWQHVYPSLTAQPFQNEMVTKWKSITTPACLPLTTDFVPTAEETQFYSESTYTVTPSDEAMYQDDVSGYARRVENLLTELIAQRLQQGFQLIVSAEGPPKVPPAWSLAPEDLVNPASGGGLQPVSKFWTGRPQQKAVTKTPYFLSLGNHVHRLASDASGKNVEVKRFVRKVAYTPKVFRYSCSIWPRDLDGYSSHSFSFSFSSLSTYNWNYLDHLISGFQDEMTESLRFWKTRFLLIPMENVSQTLPFLNPSNENLDDEELRLVGFNRFLELFEKARWSRHEDKLKDGKGGRLRRVGNALNIQLTTFNTSAFVKEEWMKSGADGIQERRRSSSPSDSFLASAGGSGSLVSMAEAAATAQLTKASSLMDIAQALQNESTGVSFQDRRWHWILYENVFTGTDCVDWLVANIADVESRDDAANFGDSLLSRGLFQHANQRHRFLDGHYFYRLNREYWVLHPTSRSKDPAILGSGWFRSNPPKAAQSDSNIDLTASVGSLTPPQQYQQPQPPPPKQKPVELDRRLVIDLDQSRRSSRREMAILHYDAIHNPKNCYHFQLHWLACTPRLIEDMLMSWSRAAEKCGFKMVEAPVEQPHAFSNDNPFQSLVTILLAVPPPSATILDHPNLSLVRRKRSNSGARSPFNNAADPSVINAAQPDDQWYECELLKRCGFVLDVESDSLFPAGAAKSTFQRAPCPRTQFVHRTGTAFVQILEHGQGFLWVNNKLHLTSTTPWRTGGSSTGGAGGAGGAGAGNTAAVNPDDLRLEFTRFCHDVEGLTGLWVNLLALKNTSPTSLSVNVDLPPKVASGVEDVKARTDANFTMSPTVADVV